VIRTASITVTTNRFDTAKTAIEDAIRRRAGRIGELSTRRPAASGRTLQAALRVPADQLDATMVELRALGRVDSESQGGSDVSDKVVDLEARLKNARVTEQRLTEILRTRAGKIGEVLEVEKAMSHEREEIERMQSERSSLGNQVEYAAIDVKVTEQDGVVTPGRQFAAAASEGWRNLVDGLSAVALFLLAYGPSVLLWGGLLALPSRYLWRRVRA
jgi:Ca-activated chloride channel homolog